jgi:hypothetical protein
MNICTDCQHCYARTDDLLYCTRLDEFNSVIDGRARTYCADQRLTDDPRACGREGKFFVRRKSIYEKIADKIKRLADCFVYLLLL